MSVIIGMALFHSGLEGSRTDLGVACYVRIIQICSPTPQSPYASGNNEELQDRVGHEVLSTRPEGQGIDPIGNWTGRATPHFDLPTTTCGSAPVATR